MTYENNDPLKLKSIRRWNTSGGGSSVTRSHCSYDITSIVFREVPASEFRLAAFGLEEPVLNNTRPGARRSYFWWINGALFAALGTWLAVRAAKKRPSTAN